MNTTSFHKNGQNMIDLSQNKTKYEQKSQTFLDFGRNLLVNSLEISYFVYELLPYSEWNIIRNDKSE